MSHYEIIIIIELNKAFSEIYLEIISFLSDLLERGDVAGSRRFRGVPHQSGFIICFYSLGEKVLLLLLPHGSKVNSQEWSGLGV